MTEFVPSPARGYSWPPFEPGNQAARKHGVWAKDVNDAALEIVSELYLPEVVERYPAMALIGAQTWERRRRALVDIEERGMVLFDDKGEARAHPLLAHVATWERTLLELSKRFGLDPRSDVELARGRADAQGAVFDLEALRARGRDAIEARESEEPEPPEAA